MTERERLFAGLSEILHCDGVTADTVLNATELWDSLALVMTLSLIDEVVGKVVRPDALEACVTAGDILKLCGS